MDTLNDIDSCGGCPGSGLGQACSEIQGAVDLACVAGKCVGESVETRYVVHHRTLTILLLSLGMRRRLDTVGESISVLFWMKTARRVTGRPLQGLEMEIIMTLDTLVLERVYEYMPSNLPNNLSRKATGGQSIEFITFLDRGTIAQTHCN